MGTGRLALANKDGIEKLHAATMRVLDETGVDVHSEKARGVFARAGAQVDGLRVRIGERVVDQALAAAPSTVRLAGREGRPDCVLDGASTHLTSCPGAVHVVDLETGERRSSTLEDVKAACRLVDALDNIEIVDPLNVATDLTPELIYINHAYAAFTSSGKPVINSVTRLSEARDLVTMAEIIAGGPDELRANPIVGTTTVVVSPLTFSAETTEILMFFGEKGLPVQIAPAPNGGVTSPITVAGTALIHNCEALAALTLSQLANPGAPVIYGGLPTVSSPRDLAYATGSIENTMMCSIASQMAARYGVPFAAYAGITDSKIADAQAGYEKALSMAIVAMSPRADLIFSAGTTEGCLSASLEQLVMDNEIFGMIRRLQAGSTISEDSMGIDAIMQAGPGGDFLTAGHTIRHMKTAVYFPTLSDRTPGLDWFAAGACDTRERARQTARTILRDHRPQVVPPAVDKRIRASIDGIA